MNTVVLAKFHHFEVCFTRKLKELSKSLHIRHREMEISSKRMNGDVVFFILFFFSLFHIFPIPFLFLLTLE